MTILLNALEMPYHKENVDMLLAQRVINVMKHESVAEHVNMNFLIDGVSRSELQEHMRHRLSSTTCESTRFTLQLMLETLENDMYSFEDILTKHFVIPPMNKESDWILNGNAPTENYKEFINDLQSWYRLFIIFFERWKIRGVKNDYLKYGLVEGYRTRFIWTINLRSLKNFLNLRLSDSAHFEIRHVANLIRETLRNTYIESLC